MDKQRIWNLTLNKNNYPLIFIPCHCNSSRAISLAAIIILSSCSGLFSLKHLYAPDITADLTSLLPGYLSIRS